MAQLRDWDSWVDQLQKDACGRRQLTLGQAFEFVAEGGYSGWYIAPLESKWTIGRMGRTQRYHIISGDDPITFPTLDTASRCLKYLLTPRNRTPQEALRAQQR